LHRDKLPTSRGINVEVGKHLSSADDHIELPLIWGRPVVFNKVKRDCVCAAGCVPRNGVGHRAGRAVTLALQNSLRRYRTSEQGRAHRVGIGGCGAAAVVFIRDVWRCRSPARIDVKWLRGKGKCSVD